MQKAVIIESENMYCHCFYVGEEVDIVSQGVDVDDKLNIRVKSRHTRQIVHLSDIAFLMPYNPS